jgi:hypothetical protein
VVGRYDQHFEELLPLEKSPVEFLRSAYDLTEQVMGMKTESTKSTPIDDDDNKEKNRGDRRWR